METTNGEMNMTKSEKEHELMARKLWCDVYKLLIVDNNSDVAHDFADGAYNRFTSRFDSISDNVYRDEKGRFKSKGDKE